MFDIIINRTVLGNYVLSYNQKAMDVIKDPITELWQLEELQRVRLYAACNGLRCSAEGTTDTLEELLEERGLHKAVEMIARTQPEKLSMMVDDLPEGIINLDWSSNRRAFEELFFAVGGCYGDD